MVHLAAGVTVFEHFFVLLCIPYWLIFVFDFIEFHEDRLLFILKIKSQITVEI